MNGSIESLNYCKFSPSHSSASLHVVIYLYQYMTTCSCDFLGLHITMLMKICDVPIEHIVHAPMRSVACYGPVVMQGTEGLKWVWNLIFTVFASDSDCSSKVKGTSCVWTNNTNCDYATRTVAGNCLFAPVSIMLVEESHHKLKLFAQHFMVPCLQLNPVWCCV